MIALETRSLNKSFGSLAVTQDVSLAFEAGLRYAIIGPNGAGKTTYFNLLAGNLRPDSGAILLRRPQRDRPRRRQPRAHRHRPIVPAQQLCSRISPCATISRSPARCARASTPIFWRPMQAADRAHAEADEIADTGGPARIARFPVRQISYGSQRQLEVALALACQPRVLLLDEPTSGMSPEETARMHELITGAAAHAHRHRHRARHGHRARFRRPDHRARLRPRARAGHAGRHPHFQSRARALSRRARFRRQTRGHAP